MATKTTPPLTPDTTQKYGPHHQPFTWIYTNKFDPRVELVATTYDVCRGVETCLEIMMNAQLHSQSHYDDTDPDDRRLLSGGDTERLLRLAIAATRMLATEADAAIIDINRRASREGT